MLTLSKIKENRKSRRKTKFSFLPHFNQTKKKKGQQNNCKDRSSYIYACRELTIYNNNKKHKQKKNCAYAQHSMPHYHINRFQYFPFVLKCLFQARCICMRLFSIKCTAYNNNVFVSKATHTLHAATKPSKLKKKIYEKIKYKKET